MNAQALLSLLLSETNVLLYGPPGTGKTHLVQEVAYLLEREDNASAIYLDTDREQGFLRSHGELRFKTFWVTFHQSYSYDNFVIGLRPDLESDRLLALRPEPGVLLQAATNASREGHASLIVIDEINRGNVGQVFGDFITVIEPDKRLAEDGSPTPLTVYVTLPYVVPANSEKVDLEEANMDLQSPFAMPRHVYTLATMNSIDRSAAPLDAAIRRRFRVVNLNVSRDAIAAALTLEAESIKFENVNLKSVLGIKTLAAYLLIELNKRIEWFLGRDIQLGQWYLGPLAHVQNSDGTDVATVVLANIWSGRIWPQLEESFALRPDQLGALLMIDSSGTGVLKQSSPPETAVDFGASPAPSFDTSASVTEVVEALLEITRRLSKDG